MDAREAIVIARRNEREADRVITLLTLEQGVVEVIARGTRKLTSKLAASLEPFTHVTVHFVPGRRWPVVTGTEVRGTWPRIAQRLAGIAQASYVAEIVQRLERAPQADPRWFKLVLAELRRIEKGRGGVTGRDAFALALFTLRALRLSGYEPNLESCSVCHQKFTATEPSWFIAHPYGVVHRACLKGQTGTPVSATTRRYVRSRLATLSAAPAFIPRRLVQEVGRLAIAALDTHLDEPLRSRRFLRLWQKRP